MDKLINKLNAYDFDEYEQAMATLVKHALDTLPQCHGKTPSWQKRLSELPTITPSKIELDQDWITIGEASDLNEAQQIAMLEAAKHFKPWRKGPFNLFGIPIDTEWVSSKKWNRLAPHLSSLSDRRILDVGCSSGYYMFRMAEHNPQLVLGVDPSSLFYHQFQLLQKYIQAPSLHMLPLCLEDLPPLNGYFDTIFNMGILYHRQSPIESLRHNRALLRDDGEFVLETITIPGDGPHCLCPEDRYAKMRNVFFLPTVKCLTQWLERAGFYNIKVIDTTVTTTDEQRKTDWINSRSLDSFLDPNDPNLTIEGYPAPHRTLIIAQARKI